MPAPFLLRALRRTAPLGLLILAVAACKTDATANEQKPVDIVKSDTSATCGMFIWKAPGPRAEAYLRGRKAPLKFGSTRDLFSYALQPENRRELQSLFVQDVAQIDWKHPKNTAATFVDARKAYYVAWQPLIGSMGPTLASFAKKPDARAFQKKNGGTLLTFDQVTEALISVLGATCPKKGAPESSLAKQCLAAEAPGKS